MSDKKGGKELEKEPEKAPEQKVDEELLKQKYMELQMAGKQIKKGQERIEELDGQLEAMAGVILSLDELKKMEPGAEMLSPISEGIFVKSTLNDNRALIVNVGGNVAVPKTVDEAKEMVRSRIGQGRKHRDELIEQLQSMVDEARQMEQELSSMVS